MEKKFRENPDVDPQIMNNIDMTQYNNRSKSYSLVKDTSVGYSVIKLNELILQKLDKNILFFRYEDFCQHLINTCKNYMNFFK